MPRKTHPKKTRQPGLRARRTPLSSGVPTFAGSLFCARCGKMSGGSESEAWTVAMHIYHTRGGVMPQRVYSCAGDGTAPFHWTRKA